MQLRRRDSQSACSGRSVGTVGIINYKNPRAAVARKSTPYTRNGMDIEPTHHARQTSSGLRADDFTHNRHGRLVSVKARKAALERYHAPNSPTKRALENGCRAFVLKMSPRAQIPAGQAGALNAGQRALLRKLQEDGTQKERENSTTRPGVYATSPRPKMARLVSRVTADSLREYSEKRRPTSA